jgi:hypothetical protein
MTSPTARQIFRETVAQVAEKARARLPQAVNGRIESAVKLVLAGDVVPQEDGTVTVFSATDVTRRYVLQGTGCTCADYERGQAPDGWCQHRIAAGIAKRVGELLHQPPAPVVPEHLELWPDNDPEPAGPAPAPGPALPEAPASVNVRVTISGREVQWTLRDTDEARLAARLEALLARYPVPQPAPQAASQPQGKDWCPIHQTAMRQTTKEGRSWFSHKVDGRWCKGK